LADRFTREGVQKVKPAGGPPGGWVNSPSDTVTPDCNDEKKTPIGYDNNEESGLSNAGTGGFLGQAGKPAVSVGNQKCQPPGFLSFLRKFGGRISERLFPEIRAQSPNKSFCMVGHFIKTIFPPVVPISSADRAAKSRYWFTEHRSSSSHPVSGQSL
jgi:hypothetical protein